MFEDVRAGLLFVLTFSAQNTCGETRRLHIIPPRTPAFSLNYEPIGGLAPGLDVRAEVEFQLPDDDEVDDLGVPFAPGEVREYVDKFVIISGDDRVSGFCTLSVDCVAAEYQTLLAGKFLMTQSQGSSQKLWRTP